MNKRLAKWQTEAWKKGKRTLREDIVGWYTSKIKADSSDGIGHDHRGGRERRAHERMRMGGAKQFECVENLGRSPQMEPTNNLELNITYQLKVIPGGDIT